MDCVICEKIAEKKALIVYEDDDFIAVLPSKPAVSGHVKVFPKKHVTKLDELSGDDAEELLFFSNVISSAVFESLQAQGTNIIINESDQHLAIDVIPRREKDGLNFMWKSKQLNPADMESIYNKIRDAAFGVGDTSGIKEKPVEIRIPEKPSPSSSSDEGKSGEHPEPGLPKEEKVNYLIKQLERIP